MVDKPWIDQHSGQWEVNPMGQDIRVNIGAGQKVIVDKLYGPLCASDVRVWIDQRDGVLDWVVEYQNPTTEQWEEKARWDCQENWPETDEA